MILVYQLIHGLLNVDASFFFSPAFYTPTRGHRFKLYKECFHKTVRSYSFSARIINDWNGLPDHVVDAGSLSSFKNLLDKHWKDCHYYYIIMTDYLCTYLCM